jgi:hypothetical protein
MLSFAVLEVKISSYLFGLADGDAYLLQGQRGEQPFQNKRKTGSDVNPQAPSPFYSTQ